jgi:peptidoglycan/xylan/chitin deacetylase (PgdA/CDA1 family)/N-acetylmuramoyl-L-alanine amidase
LVLSSVIARARSLPAGMGSCLVVGAALIAIATLGSSPAPRRRPPPVRRIVSVAQTDRGAAGPQPVGRGGPIAFEPTACLSFEPTARWNHVTVFLDPGHGGVDPGATPSVGGRVVAEKSVTLGIGLRALRLLRASGYRVVMSRVTDSTVARHAPADVHQRVLVPAAAEREIEARNLCADAAHADVLVGLHMNSYIDPSASGAETVYSPSRRFTTRSRLVAELVQQSVVMALNRAGLPSNDRGVLPDAAAGGTALTAQTENYHHLIELGPADPPWLPYPSRMPGVVVEPAFVSNPREASFVQSAHGQEVIAVALVDALDSYVHAAHLTGPRPARRHAVLAGQIPDVLPTTRHVVALTFDAGADNAGAPKILAALARTGVRATFFMTGRWAELYPRWARRIAGRYPIGNHTFDHQDLLRLPLHSVAGELLRAAASIKGATGQPPEPLFRFPYGSSSASTLAIVNRVGYTAIGWTVDTLGWEGTSLGQSVSSVTARALGHLRPGEIILMHVGANPSDHSTLDADALPGIISGIRARGYRFVTVDEYF